MKPRKYTIRYERGGTYDRWRLNCVIGDYEPGTWTVLGPTFRKLLSNYVHARRKGRLA